MPWVSDRPEDVVSSRSRRHLSELGKYYDSSESLQDNRATPTDFNTFSVTATLRARLTGGVVEDEIFFNPDFKEIKKAASLPRSEDIVQNMTIGEFHRYFRGRIEALKPNGAIIHYVNNVYNVTVQWGYILERRTGKSSVVKDWARNHDCAQYYEKFIASINEFDSFLRKYE